MSLCSRFETIHPSQNSAFVDGLLCGALIASLAVRAYKSWRDNELEIKDSWKSITETLDTAVPDKK